MQGNWARSTRSIGHVRHSAAPLLKGVAGCAMLRLHTCSDIARDLADVGLLNEHFVAAFAWAANCASVSDRRRLWQVLCGLLRKQRKWTRSILRLGEFSAQDMIILRGLLRK